MWQFIGMGLSLLGSLKAGDAMQQAGEAQQLLYNEQAGQEMQDAIRRAGLIRKMGKAQVGETKSVAAKAGLDVNSSAVSDMVNAVDSGAEQDAMMALLTGERRSRALKNQGAIAQAAGANGQTQSLLGGASNIMQLWGGGK